MKITKSVFLPDYEDTVIRDIYHDGKVTKGVPFQCLVITYLIEQTTFTALLNAAPDFTS